MADTAGKALRNLIPSAPICVICGAHRFRTPLLPLSLAQMHRQLSDQRTVVSNALRAHGFGSITERRD